MAQEYSGAGYRSRSLQGVEHCNSKPEVKVPTVRSHHSQESPAPFLVSFDQKPSEVFRRHRFPNCCSPDWVLVEQPSQTVLEFRKIGKRELLVSESCVIASELLAGLACAPSRKIDLLTFYEATVEKQKSKLVYSASLIVIFSKTFLHLQHVCVCVCVCEQATI